MTQIELTTEQQLDELWASSNERPVMLFKHSTRCSVSTDAQRQFDAAADVPEGDRATWVYLDLIRYRDLSNAIAERTGISHASPQTILLWKGEVVWDASHWSITTSALNEAVLVDEA